MRRSAVSRLSETIRVNTESLSPSPMQLLLIEDDPTLQTSLRRTLERRGMRVRLCADGLLALAQWRFWRTDVVRTHPGRLAGEFLIAYALVRAIGEVFREPDAGLILGLSRGTFYSLFMVMIGVWLILRRPTPLPLANPGTGVLKD